MVEFKRKFLIFSFLNSKGERWMAIGRSRHVEEYATRRARRKSNPPVRIFMQKQGWGKEGISIRDAHISLPRIHTSEARKAILVPFVKINT